VEHICDNNLLNENYKLKYSVMTISCEWILKGTLE
jgi:hypothetical protein